jgi:hypothetical protein
MLESKSSSVCGVGCCVGHSPDWTSEQTTELWGTTFSEPLFWLVSRRVWSWGNENLREFDDDQQLVMIKLEGSPQGLPASSVSVRSDNRWRMRGMPLRFAGDAELNDDDLSPSNFVLFARQATILFVVSECFLMIAKRSLKIPRHGANVHRSI